MPNQRTYWFILIISVFAIPPSARTETIVWPTAEDPPPGARCSFYVMGDVPYSIDSADELPEDERDNFGFLRAEEHHIARHLVAMNRDVNATFAIHVGDIKRGSWPCEEAFFLKTWALLRGSQLPMFIIPGDNEWNDCGDPVEAWRLWRKYFSDYDVLWPNHLNIARQASTAPDDFAFHFTEEGALIIGVNVTGMNAETSEQYFSIFENAAAWVQSAIESQEVPPTHIVVLGHAGIRGDGPRGIRAGKGYAHFVGALMDLTNKHEIPTLYINGDSHRWDPKAPAFEGAPHLARLTVDEGGSAPPARVTTTTENSALFIIDRGKRRGTITIGYDGGELRITSEN